MKALAKSVFAAFLLAMALLAGTLARAETDIAGLSLQMFSVQGEAKRPIVEKLVATGERSLIPTFVLAMRWTGDNKYVAKALSDLTETEIKTWHEAYEWQELNPQIIPHESYRALKMRFLGNTDRNFLDFFKDPYGKRERMKIRLEEISWGGVLVDVGIPSLDNPPMIDAKDADYLVDDDLVFGVEINGDVRAYPLRIMGWHEMFNDTIGGVPVALAYCTLCGAGILFETEVKGRDAPFVFATSGLLYRSNKLMFDRETRSLWNQFTGEPVVGPLADSGIKLKIHPNTITSWANWKAKHPRSKVLSIDTGFIRNYASGFIYREYFASPDLMFPAVVGDESQIKRKEYVFGIQQAGAAKAWPVEAFRDRRVINDTVGGVDVVLIGDAATRTVRAYQREAGEVFNDDNDGELETTGESWAVTEAFLVSRDQKHKRVRVPGHVSYWFAWNNYHGVKSELFSD